MDRPVLRAISVLVDFMVSQVLKGTRDPLGPKVLLELSVLKAALECVAFQDWKDTMVNQDLQVTFAMLCWLCGDWLCDHGVQVNLVKEVQWAPEDTTALQVCVGWCMYDIEYVCAWVCGYVCFSPSFVFVLLRAFFEQSLQARLAEMDSQELKVGEDLLVSGDL
jgi:hypothetical protein